MMKVWDVWNQLNEAIPIEIIVEKDADARKAYMNATRNMLHIIEESKALKETEYKTLKRIRNKINDIWINYLYGRVNTASSQMQNLMHSMNGTCSYLSLFEEHTEESMTLFRGRISQTPLTQESDFYHIPFDKRYLIGNQRYSLSGIPCLYLASSKACVYAELGTNQQVRLCQMISNHSFSIFDLSMKEERCHTRKEFLSALYRLPLQYACSIQALDNDGAAFKTNYIIPQLLTATLYNMNAGIQGICYLSIRGTLQPMEQRKNYVFLPEYRLGKSVYDMELISSFSFEIEEKGTDKKS